MVSTLPSGSQARNRVADFVRQHKHVHKLLVRERDSHLRDSSCLSRLIAPIQVEGGFNNLSCLSLAWGR